MIGKKTKRILLVIALLFLVDFLRTKTSKLPQKKADVIIVLGTSPNPDKKPNPILKFRIDKGIELYKKGFGKKIIVTGTKVGKYFEAEVMKEYCVTQGIPVKDIIEERKAKNTIENALFSAKIMKENNFKSAIVVSSRTHLKRAKFLFSRYSYNFEYTAANQNFIMYFMSLPVYLVEEVILLKTKKEFLNSNLDQSRKVL